MHLQCKFSMFYKWKHLRIIIDLLYSKNGAEHWCNLVDVTSLSTLMHVYGYSENSMSHMITLSIYFIIHDEQFVILKVKHVNKKKTLFVCIYHSRFIQFFFVQIPMTGENISVWY